MLNTCDAGDDDDTDFSILKGGELRPQSVTVLLQAHRLKSGMTLQVQGFHNVTLYEDGEAIKILHEIGQLYAASKGKLKGKSLRSGSTA